MKGCDNKCKVLGTNRGPCCDKPGCDTRTVEFDTRSLLNNSKAVNNIGGHGPQTADGGNLAEEMRLPEAGSFIDTDSLNGVADATIVFDVVITAINTSASGRNGGTYQPKTPAISGIYKDPRHDVGDKADIIAINFGECNNIWVLVLGLVLMAINMF